MKLRKNTDGFTVIELMISTIVFSVVLLIASGAIISLARQYYKGVTQSKLQETGRTIASEVAGNIKYETGVFVNMAPGATVKAYCIADKQYTFILGKQLGDNVSANQSKSVLKRKNGCDASTIPSESSFRSSDTTPGTELIGENMRLSDFSIYTDSTGQLITIDVRVVYGADDQLCLLAVPGDCDPGGVSPYVGMKDVACKVQPGSQFCGFAEYKSIVTKRL